MERVVAGWLGLGVPKGWPMKTLWGGVCAFCTNGAPYIGRAVGLGRRLAQRDMCACLAPDA